MGSEVPSTYTEAILRSLSTGIPVVTAIGNDGQQITGSPGNDLLSFRVRATDYQDCAAVFSGDRTKSSASPTSFPLRTCLSSIPNRKYRLPGWQFSLRYRMASGPLSTEPPRQPLMLPTPWRCCSALIPLTSNTAQTSSASSLLFLTPTPTLILIFPGLIAAPFSLHLSSKVLYILKFALGFLCSF